jgi:hypothetical protein
MRKGGNPWIPLFAGPDFVRELKEALACEGDGKIDAMSDGPNDGPSMLGIAAYHIDERDSED